MLHALASQDTLHINARGVTLSGANGKGPFEKRLGANDETSGETSNQPGADTRRVFGGSERSLR